MDKSKFFRTISRKGKEFYCEEKTKEWMLEFVNILLSNLSA